MPLIQIPKTVRPLQVEVPDTVKERSCEGAIHLRPGVKRLTDQEWDVVKKAHPSEAKRCVVVKAKEGKHAAAVRAGLAKKAGSAPEPRDKRALAAKRKPGERVKKKQPKAPAPNPPAPEAKSGDQKPNKGKK